MVTKRYVIGLVGPIASGKSVVAQFLRDQGFAYQSLSDRVRDEANLRGLPLTRANLQNIGNELREEFGAAVLAERSAILLGSHTDYVVIDSIRNPAEIVYLKEVLGAVIIGIDAPEELRLAWYLERAKHRGEDNPTTEDFLRANARDLGIGEGATGQQVTASLNLADAVIQNLGSKEELIERFMEIFNQFRRSPEGSHHSPELL